MTMPVGRRRTLVVMVYAIALEVLVPAIVSNDYPAVTFGSSGLSNGQALFVQYRVEPADQLLASRRFASKVLINKNP